LLGKTKPGIFEKTIEFGKQNTSLEQGLKEKIINIGLAIGSVFLVFVLIEVGVRIYLAKKYIGGDYKITASYVKSRMNL